MQIVYEYYEWYILPLSKSYVFENVCSSPMTQTENQHPCCVYDTGYRKANTGHNGINRHSNNTNDVIDKSDSETVFQLPTGQFGLSQFAQLYSSWLL